MKMCLTYFKLTFMYVASICGLLILPEMLYAIPQTKLPMPLTGRHEKTAPAYHWYNHVEWENEAWTGDDKPYQKLRTQINSFFALTPQNGKMLLVKAAAGYKAHPTSPTALFRWAYIDLKLSPSPLFLGEDGLDVVRDAFARPLSPHTYDYTRLRFLLYQNPIPDERLFGLAKRLLKHTPEDFTVQFYYISLLRNSGDPTNMQLALAEVQKLIQQQPKMPSLYALRASIYYQNWVRDKILHQPKQADGDLCIAAYRDYLNRIPTNDPFRKNAEDVINWVQTR